MSGRIQSNESHPPHMQVLVLEQAEELSDILSQHHINSLGLLLHRVLDRSDDRATRVRTTGGGVAEQLGQQTFVVYQH